ncbi:MAG: 4Fe-4S dicluster domain-containing protein [Candidatus Hodarchaeota archaeon]
MVLVLEQRDKALVEETLRILGEQDPLACYQCNKCTSGCPIALVRQDFRPHLIVQQTRMGLKDVLIKEEAIWYCCQCLKCVARCPQKVAPYEIIFALRILAAEAGYLPKNIAKLLQAFWSKGMITAPMIIVTKDFAEATRQTLGLPALVVDTKGLRKALQTTKLPLIIENLKKSKELPKKD